MAPKAKKTYSRKKSEFLNSSKNDSDPFDKLLSSPLKQEVDFKPLSFWGKKSEYFSSGAFTKVNAKHISESSDSDVSPDHRKVKNQWKCLKGKTKPKHSGTGLLSRKNASYNTNKKSLIRPQIKCENECSICDNEIEGRHLKYVTFRRNVNRYYNKETPSVSCSETVNKSENALPKICEESGDDGSSLWKTYVIHNDQKRSSSDEYKESILSPKQDGKANTVLAKVSDICKKSLENIYSDLWKVTTHNEQEIIEYDESLINDYTLIAPISSSSLSNVTSNSPDFEDINDDGIANCSYKIQQYYKTFDYSHLHCSDISNNNMIIVNEGVGQHSLLQYSNTQEFSTSSLTGSNDTYLDTTSFRDDSRVKPLVPQPRISALINEVSELKISSGGNISEAEKEKTGDSVETTPTAMRNYNSPLVESSVVGEKKVSVKPRNSMFRNVTTRRRFKNVTQHKALKSPLDFKKRETKIRFSLLEKENFGQPKFNSTVICSPVEEKERKNRSGPKLVNLTNKKESECSSLSLAGSPMFESTKIFNSGADCEQSTVHQTNRSVTTVNLKPGKQWVRSLSILRQLQNESNTLNVTKVKGVKGRHHQTLVEEIREMQELSDNEAQTIHGDSFSNLSNNKTIESSFLLPDKTAFISSIKEVSDSKTLLQQTICTRKRTIMGPTVKIMDPEDSYESDSTLKNAFEFQNNISVLQDISKRINASSAREVILAECDQTEVLPFGEYFNEKTLKGCKKIGEGVFGEVFMCDGDTVFKVIPVEGDQEVNGEPQKRFEEIISEVITASKLSKLREEGTNQTSGFSKMKRCWCVSGKYPTFLLDLWNDYDIGRGSENDSPEMFNSDQLYIVLELENGGKDLESFVFNSAEQSYSIFIQAAFSLAVAETEFEFEHRDLHWGNLLISPTKDKFMSVVLNGVTYKIPTKGVKVSIIDFTLSRILHEGCCLFNDLSVDPTLFASQGDYQFEIYRMMQKELENDWSQFRPKTNVFWLHYTIDKMLKMVRYKNKTSRVHKKYSKELKTLESAILDYDNCSDFVVNVTLQ